MVFAFVRHSIRQGVYKASDIAVLKPYLGQLRKLRRSLSSFAEVVINDRDADELTLVDNDGEEKAKIDLIEKNKVPASVTPAVGVHKSTLLQALRLATIDPTRRIRGHRLELCASARGGRRSNRTSALLLWKS
jgi:hypothetical protein